MAKQIIIDEIDVSKCTFYKGYCRIAALCDYSGHLCEVTPNCYFKQRKQAEQKLEKIKNILIYCKNQSGCIGCKYENECDASYNFENWILKIIEDKKDE